MMNTYPDKVSLNGKIVNPGDAKISVFDRGFIFGDGIYEVLLKIKGKFFYKEAHFNRLSRNLKKISINCDVLLIEKQMYQLLQQTKLDDKDCLIYIQITRGVAPRQHAFPKNIEPTVFIYAIPFTLPDISNKQVKVITKTDNRWQHCDIKMTSLLGNIMSKEYAVQNDAHEAILIRDGFVTEASHSNVFFVKDDIVYTHHANQLILNGITRQIIIDLCKELNIIVKEEAIKEEQIHTMDEAFLAGTASQIVSIKQINEHYFYKGDTVGAITKKLQDAFLQLKRKNINI